MPCPDITYPEYDPVICTNQSNLYPNYPQHQDIIQIITSTDFIIFSISLALFVLILVLLFTTSHRYLSSTTISLLILTILFAYLIKVTFDFGYSYYLSSVANSALILIAITSAVKIFAYFLNSNYIDYWGNILLYISIAIIDTIYLFYALLPTIGQ